VRIVAREAGAASASRGRPKYRGEGEGADSGQGGEDKTQPAWPSRQGRTGTMFTRAS